VHPLGRLLREMAVELAGDLPGDALLFVNVNPLEVYDPRLLEVGPALRPWASRMVLEINKSREVGDQFRLLQSMQKLRERGFRIGLDDLCPGYMGLNSLARLTPDFARVGATMLRKARSDERARRLLQHFLEYCRGEGIRSIANGIANAEEARQATEAGFDLLQGSHYPEVLGS
jgi:EAL domain-containing protein (putative c-di-GMP-specific phosphodiesterase class I)